MNPFQCGPNQCPYDNLCLAEAVGYSDSDCCPIGNGACTVQLKMILSNVMISVPIPVRAALIWLVLSKISAANKQPKEVAACTVNFAPVACSTVNCIYDNTCIAGTLVGVNSMCEPLLAMNWYWMDYLSIYLSIF